MEPLTDKELKRIKEMDRIIGRKLPLIREEVSRDEAHKRITALKESYKLENLDSIKEDPITIYHIGKGFTIFRLNIVWKVLRIALNLFLLFTYIYQLTIPLFVIMRILAFNIFIVEFSHNDAGEGLVFSHPRGAIVRHVMEDLWKKIHMECGYDMLYTPHVAKLSTDELPLSYLGLQKEALLIS
ncbi:hypothetical protein COP1_022423 [Malus domestica]